MKKVIGGVVNQNEMLTRFESRIGKSSVDTAGVLNTGYSTYKSWKGGQREMTGPTVKLVKILTMITGTELGKLYGV